MCRLDKTKLTLGIIRARPNRDGWVALRGKTSTAHVHRPARGTRAVVTFEVGSVVSERYRIVRKMGEGGMGAVYEVEHVQLGRKLALKTLHPELARSADVVARFQREARAAAAVGSPHIVDVVDLGAADGSPFIVMEFLDGGSLRDLLEEQGQLAIPRVLAIVTQCCKALAKAHAKGIVHRDLKPDNIMLVDRDGGDFVKLVDFGIAKLVEDSIALDAVATTRTGITMGTPQYMSPEQIAGASDIDARADVWAMGAVLFELLTGKPPFEATTMPMLAVKIHSEKTPSVRELRPAIPARLDAIVQKALAKERDDRFATIAELGAVIHALKMSPAATTRKPAGAFQFEEDTRVDTSPPGARASGARITTTPRAWDVEDSQPPKPPKRTALFVGLGALGLLAVGGGIALAVVLADPAQPPRSAAPERPVATLADALRDRSATAAPSAVAPVATVGSEPIPPTTRVHEPAAPANITPEPAPAPAPVNDREVSAIVERRVARPRTASSRRELAPSSTAVPVEPPRPSPPATPAPAPPPTRADVPRASGRRIAIRNGRQLAVTVTLTCGDAAAVNVRVPAGASRTVAVADGACRIRCDDGVSVGSLCGTRLAAAATSLVIR
ncbi:MAG: serine/threonine protein kinase [Deltaproteobacteria bacterium]|nr:serine/threonine protein kinase [Deltaproteobacteria bacterium]